MNDLVLKEQLEPGILHLSLNRPEKRNALNIALLESLCNALEHASKEHQRVVILSGADPLFCTGLDLAEASDLNLAHKSAQLVAKALKGLSSNSYVTIGLAHGAAVAGGAGLISACDLALSSPDCQFGYPETRRGLVAGLVMTFLKRQVGERAARELLLTGELIKATRALDLGLLNEIVNKEQLLTRALELARSVIKGGPHAVAETKHLLDTLHPPTIEDDLKHALKTHLTIRNSKEAQEGIAAFIEKRKPMWEA
jgi:methylglutaconyl-CoA hydratase